jgi:hypothetical protein
MDNLRATTQMRLEPGFLACLGLVLISLLLFALNTRHGIGIYVDTLRYMELSPVNWDAPVYPWMLKLGKGLGISVLTAASIVAVLTLCANIVLAFSLINRASGDWRFATVGCALIAFSPQFVNFHASAMSEAPFIMFLLLTIWTALNYLENSDRIWLIASSLLLCVATLTRFTAPPLGIAIAALILCDPRLSTKRRWTDAALLAGVGGGLFFAWVGYSQLTAGRSIGRVLAFYGNMGQAEWLGDLKTVAAWLFPDKVGLELRVALLLGLLGFAAWMLPKQLKLWRGGRDQSLPSSVPLTLILGLFFIGYLAFVYLSTSIEANLSLTGRYAFPAYCILVMLITVLASSLERSQQGLLLTLAILAGAMLVSHSVRSAVRTSEVYRDGFGFHHSEWRTSPTMDAVGRLPSNAKIYSNGPDVITFLLGRQAHMSPADRQPRTDLPDPGTSLEIELGRVREDAGQEPVYLVMFDRIDWRFYLASENLLKASLTLVPVETFADGRIYQVDPATGVHR